MLSNICVWRHALCVVDLVTGARLWVGWMRRRHKPDGAYGQLIRSASLAFELAFGIANDVVTVAAALAMYLCLLERRLRISRAYRSVGYPVEGTRVVVVELVLKRDALLLHKDLFANAHGVAEDARNIFRLRIGRLGAIVLGKGIAGRRLKGDEFRHGRVGVLGFPETVPEHRLLEVITQRSGESPSVGRRQGYLVIKPSTVASLGGECRRGGGNIDVDMMRRYDPLELTAQPGAKTKKRLASVVLSRIVGLLVCSIWATFIKAIQKGRINKRRVASTAKTAMNRKTIIPAVTSSRLLKRK